MLEESVHILTRPFLLNVAYHRPSDDIREASRMLVLRRPMTMVLLLFYLGPLGTPLAMVLCFGADGHIGFEPTHDRSHGTTAPVAAGLFHQHGTNVFAGIEHSGPCIDVAFSVNEGGGQFLLTSDTCPRPVAPGSAPVLTVVPAPSKIPLPSILPDLSVSSHHPLTILHSTVLRI
jgi:hypothetical protein